MTKNTKHLSTRVTPPSVWETQPSPATGLPLAGVAQVGTLGWDVNQVVRLPQVRQSVGDGGLPGAGHLVHPVHHPPHPVRPHDVGLRDRDPVRNLTFAQLYYCVLSSSVDSDAILTDKKFGNIKSFHNNFYQS